jgi:hypothetical protein
MGPLVAMALLLPSLGLALGPPVRWSSPSLAGPLATAGNADLSGSWTFFAPTKGQPFERAGAALAFDPVEGLGVLFGGRAANGTVLNDTWVNDGDFPGRWGLTPYALQFAPPPLVGAALTFDSTFNEFLLFGGALPNGTAYNGTWAFGGFAWTDLTSHLRTAPPADLYPTMAFDPALGEVVLVSSADPGATWTFGSGGWTALPSSDWLAPTTNATALEDPSVGGVLLFGGQSVGTDPRPLNATWSFTTAGWQSVTTAQAPPAELRPAMSYDPRIPGTLLFSSTTIASTWTYTSVGWSSVPGSPTPEARSDAQLYYDSDASYDSLFGGVSPNGTIASDNWGWSVPPSVLTPTLGAASIGLITWAEIGAIIAVPIIVALILRRRPPRANPTDAPAASASAASS